MDKQVARFGPLKNFIANGVKVDNVVYLSGQVGINKEGSVVEPGNIVAQVREAYVNIEEVLSRFDAKMDNIVDETWFVTDIQDVMGKIKEVFGVRAEAYGKDPDVTQTMIQVTGLVMPELLVEIKCVAHL